MLVPSTQQLGSIWSGLLAGGTIPDPILRSGMDDLGKIAYLTRDMASFAYVLSKRFGQKKLSVEDRVYKSYELAELDRTYTVTVASTDTNHQTFGLSNAQAAQLQPEDILYLRDLYATVINNDLFAGQVNANNAVPTTPNTPPSLGYSVGPHPQQILFSRAYGYINGVHYCEFEQVKVLSIGAPNSASVGNTTVTVERCFMGPGNKGVGRAILNRGLVYSPTVGIQAVPTVANFQVGDVILRGSPAFKEGTNAPDGIFKFPEFDENYTQEIKYGISFTTEAELRKIWINEKPLDINRWLTTRRMLRDYEFMLMFGRAGYDKDAQGKETFLMGGVEEFIPKDTSHRLKYRPGTLSWPDLLRFGKEIFTLGGSPEKFLFVGYSLDAALRAMFYDSGHMIMEPALSKEFNMEVNCLNVSGGKINVIPCQIMEEAGYGMKGFCLDLGFPSFVPVHTKDWDMKVDTNDGKGIQERGVQIYKEQIIGMRGLQRRYSDYQVELDFSNVA